MASLNNVQIDLKFFEDLIKWEYQGHDIRDALRAIRRFGGVEDVPAFSGLFPARGHMKLLARLLSLAPISEEDGEIGLPIQYLADDTIQWWDFLLKSLNTKNTGDFTGETWKVISKVWEMIVEICIWVAEKEHDGPFYWFEYREIDNLANRIRRLVNDESLYVLSGSIKSFLQKASIHKSDPFKKNGRQKQTDLLAFLERNLDPYIITTTSTSNLRCYDGTRMGVLDDIKQWINAVPSSRNKSLWHTSEQATPPSQNFLWLTGEPSCGKSAVAGSIVRYCLERTLLGATLYIDPSANPDSYFPTIARQISLYFSEVSHGRKILQQYLYDTLKAEPMLVRHLSTRQASVLFVETVKKASGIEPKKPFVTIIDGLDKVKEGRLKETVAILSGVIEELGSCPNAKIMICGGRGVRIPGSRNIKRVFLDRSEPFADVLAYICKQLDASSKQYNVGLWVSGDDKRLRKMAHQASGDIYKAFAVNGIILRHIMKYGAFESQVQKLLDLLSIDIGTAESKFDDQESRWCSEITSSLCEVLEDPQGFRLLLRSNSRDAQVILDSCQLILESSPDLSSKTEGQITAAMSRLSATTGLYPKSLLLSADYVKDRLERSPEPVNSGAFGDVYKLSFEGQAVCLKMSRANKELISHMAKIFSKEGIVWSRLSHPNILPFYGLSVFNSQVSLVAPWANNGNIREFLSRQESNNPNRILLCADTAAGVQYLHEKGMVHGDLKTANVLVDLSGRACVADFGLSNVHDSRIPHWTSQSSVASKGGTSRYQAPELHIVESDDVDASSGRRAIHNTKATDVYAWGGLCYEILTDNVPFHELSNEYTVVFQIMKGGTPSKPHDTSDAWLRNGLTAELWDLMLKCWKRDPEERPTMAAVVSQLEGLKPHDGRPPPQWPAADPVSLGCVEYVIRGDIRKVGKFPPEFI
ncbi:hypothetical protein C0991_001523 [Blastosporella zonata]|nr:hypothetical protein C0991_001523 [Blastosporella zonata]